MINLVTGTVDSSSIDQSGCDCKCYRCCSSSSSSSYPNMHVHVRMYRVHRPDYDVFELRHMYQPYYSYN